MMGKRKKAGASLTPSHRAPRAYFPSLQPSCDTNKPLSGTSMFAGKKFSHMYLKINRSVKTP